MSHCVTSIAALRKWPMIISTDLVLLLVYILPRPPNGWMYLQKFSLYLYLFISYWFEMKLIISDSFKSSSYLETAPIYIFHRWRHSNSLLSSYLLRVNKVLFLRFSRYFGLYWRLIELFMAWNSCIQNKTGDYTYLHDYYDEKTLSPEVLSQSIRVYIIFTNLRTNASFQYEKYDQIRQFTRQLIRVIEVLKRSDIGHGHLGKS